MNDVSALSVVVFPDPVPPLMSTLQRARTAREQVAQRRRPRPVVDKVVGAEPAPAKAADREHRAVERKRRDDHVHARAVGQPRVAQRLGLVDAASERREDALDCMAQVGFAVEARGGRLDAALALHPDLLGPVDHDLVDGRVGQQRLERTEPEGALRHPGDEMRAGVVVEQPRLAIDERADALVHVTAVAAAAGRLAEQPVAQRACQSVERLVAVHALLGRDRDILAP